MRKKIVTLGSILVLLGLVALIVPRPKASAETVNINTWDLPIKTLGPQNKTWFVQSMRPGEWFQLNVSSTNTVELEVSLLSNQGATKTSIFRNQNTRFTQRVMSQWTGSYEIDIVNISTSTVTLGGNVVAQRSETTTQNMTPYAFLGFLLMLGGAITLYFGISKKPFRSKAASMKRKRI